MDYKIVIDFDVKEKILTNSTSFENNPKVNDVINALNSNLEGFKKAVIEKVNKEGISDDEFDRYLSELKVNDLI